MPEKLTFHQIRKEYANQGIDESSLPKDPIELFQQWYKIAEENQPGDWVEANAMSLATAGKDGRVSNRYVLLKGVDENGIRFYSNYDSDKGQQIAENPRASAAFLWAYLSRQVRFEGSIEKTSRADSEKYFHSRPRGSQLGAWASQQSSEVESWEVWVSARRRWQQSMTAKPSRYQITGAGTESCPIELSFGRGV